MAITSRQIKQVGGEEEIVTMMKGPPKTRGKIANHRIKMRGIKSTSIAVPALALALPSTMN